METVIVGAGQAGLAVSWWLTRAGISHRIVERRADLGGGWLDRWDSFVLNTPNFMLRLPGLDYDGTEPEGFLGRDDVLAYVRRLAAQCGAPVETGMNVSTVSRNGTRWQVATPDGTISADAVVLATGAFSRPRLPEGVGPLPEHIVQLHTSDYRRPAQLPAGRVLVVGSGQSGGQIAEDLASSGREVHLSVSSCPQVPRRYRGHDLFTWMSQIGSSGPSYGVPLPAPPPEARMACSPLLAGGPRGEDLTLRSLADRGVRLHGRFLGAEGGLARFSDDFPERLHAIESSFHERMAPMIDRFIAAAGLDVPPAAQPPHHGPPPPADPTLGLSGVGTIIWATGYQLDFGFLEDSSALDAWGYPKHRHGHIQDGLYVLGLPWLTAFDSPILAGVGRDAQAIANDIEKRASVR